MYQKKPDLKSGTVFFKGLHCKDNDSINLPTKTLTISKGQLQK